MRYTINQPLNRGVKISSLISGFAALAFAASVALTGGGAASAATNTLVVDENNSQGWVFNPDLTNATPYEFNDDEASLGDGSLFVEPISSTAAHKFIAAKTLDVPVPNLTSVSYDFLVAGDGVAADAQHFYLNVYTKLADSTAYYNCRFDYVPGIGSTTDFTTATFAATSTPSDIADRAGDDFNCPATLAGMPADSTASFITLNVGDTSANDDGLAGYFDNVVVSTLSDTTTYDFEHITLADAAACKKDGWMVSLYPSFKNQGDCVSYFATEGRNEGSSN